jgi:PPOX class probable F420-dependent enzyme
MTGEQARALFATARVVRLATTGPHLVPICFAVEGDTIWSAVDTVKPKTGGRLRRVRNITADPHVALLADHYVDDDWDVIWWARADGLATVHDDAPHARDLLCARYPQYAAEPPDGPFIEVSVSRWSGWSGSH